jgi:hypothetical protein
LKRKAQSQTIALKWLEDEGYKTVKGKNRGDVLFKELRGKR